MYTTEAKITERLSEDKLIDLASETETLDTAASAVIATCVADADAEIDSYIAARYALPLETVPALIEKISTELTIVNLFKKRDIISEDVNERYKWAKDMLEKLAKGSITLSVETTEDTPQKIIIESEELRGW